MRATAISIGLALLAFGCGGSGGADAAAGDAGSLCARGCVATLAAACAHGPADQASCESDCQMLANGTCGSQYLALQTCAEGMALTCDASGRPTVPGCSAQQTAFQTCLAAP